MKIEDQVCSLELAMRLKELGVKQESLFYWVRPIDEWQLTLVLTPEDKAYFIHSTVDAFPMENYSAFSVAEFGEMLPAQRSVDHPLGYIEILTFKSPLDGQSYYMIESVGDEIFDIADKNEANARAKMLIYLIENGLVT